MIYLRREDEVAPEEWTTEINDDRSNSVNIIEVFITCQI